MATLTLRAEKGAPLTNAEVDANFIALSESSSAQTGDILDTMRPAPDGYLLANGAWYARDDYPELDETLGGAFRSEYFTTTSASNTGGDYYSLTTDGLGNWVSLNNTTRSNRSDDDGLTFKAPVATGVTIPTSASSVFKPLAYGNGRFLVIGGSQASYSDDGGATWVLGGKTTQEVGIIAYTGAAWIATSTSNASDVLRSTDNGVTWTRIMGTNAGGPPLQLLVLGGGKVIACYQHNSNSQIRYSQDHGETWTSGTTGLPSVLGFRPMAVSDTGRIGFIGQNGIIKTSDDNGATWVTRETAVLAYGSMYVSGSSWVACQGTQVYVSLDNALTWKSVQSKATPFGGIAWCTEFDGVWFLLRNNAQAYACSNPNLDEWYVALSGQTSGSYAVTSGGTMLVQFTSTYRTLKSSIVRRQLKLPNIANRAPSVAWIKT